ncbi:MAG: hypothetical protein IJ462_04280 [Clostridia bacterium]|nr:hypothetical protein [Clostridia bacterium]
MKNIYTNTFNLRTSDFNCNNSISPAAVLDLFQEVAGAHAEELSCGFVKMLEKKQLWVVVRAKFKMLKQIEYHTPVTVTTWPLAPSRIGFQREYKITDRHGDTAVIGSTDWVVMHSEERRLLPVSDIYPADMEYIGEKVFDGRNKKLHDNSETEYIYSLTPQYSDIDLNGHVNNAKYAEFIMDALKLDTTELIDEMQIDFHRELKRGEEVKIFAHRQEKEIFIKGQNPQDETSFTCRIILK